MRFWTNVGVVVGFLGFSLPWSLRKQIPMRSIKALAAGTLGVFVVGPVRIPPHDLRNFRSNVLNECRWINLEVLFVGSIFGIVNRDCYLKGDSFVATCCLYFNSNPRETDDRPGCFSAPQEPKL
jgi:hypothetical protein